MKLLAKIYHYPYAKLWQKFVLKLRAMKGSPEQIAAGFAIGAAMTFTPFVGLHLILSVVLAWIFRVNSMAAALGTVLGNPWTFPLIWIAVLYSGRFMLGASYEGATKVDFVHFFDKSLKALMNLDFDLFFQDIWPILYPMMIGCIPYCLVVWILCYVGVKTILGKLQKPRVV